MIKRNMSGRIDDFLGLETKVTGEELIAWIRHEAANRARINIYHNNRPVGVIYRHPILGKIFVTYRRKSEHVYEKWKTIGISREVLIKLICAGVDRVVILFTDTKEVYTCAPHKFIERGKALWFKDESDPQLHLPLDLLDRL